MRKVVNTEDANEAGPVVLEAAVELLDSVEGNHDDS